MTVTVIHSTAPDDSFSETGAAAWSANHTLTGVGTMAEQNANNVNITGGSITGVTGVGTVTGVTGTAPVASSGGTTPAISIPKATTSVDGYLSATDWTTFNNKLSTAVTSATAGTGMSVSASTGPVTFTNTAPDQVVVLTDGTAIDVTGTYPNFTINNTAPDQIVALTGAGTTSISGTYPNFTITSADSKLGDVVGPASATDNAVARFDTTTGKLIQNSLVIVDDTGSVTGVNALTAQSLTVNNNATLGSSNTDSIDVRGRISSDLEPETNNAKDIGTNGRNWRDGFFGRTLHTVNLELTGTTSFDGSQGTSGQVLTSQGAGNTPVWATPTTGSVTSVSGTAPIASSGGATPAISISQSGAATDGYLSATDWNTFNGKQPAGTYVNSVSATSPITSSGGVTPTIAMPAATNSVNGYLTSTDWTTFNNKSNTVGTVTSVSGTGTVSGLTLSGTVTSSGNLTLGGTLQVAGGNF